MWGPKRYGFSAILVINRVLILAIFVINRVWFLHYSLELGMFLLRNITSSRLEYKNHALFITKMAKINTLFMTKMAERPYRFGPHISHTPAPKGELVPPPPPGYAV